MYDHLFLPSPLFMHPYCLNTRLPHTHTLLDYREKVRVVSIYVGADNKEESWAAAIDPSGSVLDHLQLPYGRDAKAKRLKVGEGRCLCLW